MTTEPAAAVPSTEANLSRLVLLRRETLFSELDETTLQKLAGALKQNTFDKGMVIFHRDAPGDRLFLIKSGRIRIFVRNEIGQEITINIHGPGECFGELSLLDGQPRSAGAEAMEAAVIYTLHRNDFLRYIHDHPGVAMQILKLLSQRLRHSTNYAESLAFYDVPSRIALVLLDLADKYGVRHDGIEIDLELTQSELARWVAASREMVNKVLARFREQGLISIDKKTVVILNKAGLKQMIC